MGEDFTTTKLNAESQLLLEQPLLRLPHELSRKNFKSIQKSFEHEKSHILSTLKTTANASLSGSQTPEQALTSIDSMLARLNTLKRKMETVAEEESKIQSQSRRRIEHLGELYNMHSLVDVKYEEWSRTRLNRLLVDYLLRMGYENSARKLVEEKGLEDLVDLDVFAACHRVADSLKRGSTAEALAWCVEHKTLMRKEKANSALEFELRLQQYIELVRKGKSTEAKAHALKYLSPQIESYPNAVFQATGLLAYPPDTKLEPYKTLYSKSRWIKLAELFTKTHHELFSLPASPLLHIALSAGLSALKTPSCHSAFASSTANAKSSTTTVCPICSTELNELARPVPYAHHSKSFVENDPVVLPNGRVYGRERLNVMARKLGLDKGQWKDPTTGEVFAESEGGQIFFP